MIHDTNISDDWRPFHEQMQKNRLNGVTQAGEGEALTIVLTLGLAFMMAVPKCLDMAHYLFRPNPIAEPARPFLPITCVPIQVQPDQSLNTTTMFPE